jgi:hypothetical protein
MGSNVVPGNLAGSHRDRNKASVCQNTGMDRSNFPAMIFEKRTNLIAFTLENAQHSSVGDVLPGMFGCPVNQ